MNFHVIISVLGLKKYSKCFTFRRKYGYNCYSLNIRTLSLLKIHRIYVKFIQYCLPMSGAVVVFLDGPKYLS